MSEDRSEGVEWVRLVKRVAEPLLHIQVFSGKRYYEEVTGIEYKLRRAKFEDWFYWMMAEKTELRGEELVNESRKLASNISSLGNDELSKRFAQYNLLFCDASLLSRELQVPCVVGTDAATTVLKDEEVVEVDARKGLVRRLASTAK